MHQGIQSKIIVTRWFEQLECVAVQQVDSSTGMSDTLIPLKSIDALSQSPIILEYCCEILNIVHRCCQSFFQEAIHYLIFEHIFGSWDGLLRSMFDGTLRESECNPTPIQDREYAECPEYFCIQRAHRLSVSSLYWLSSFRGGWWCVEHLESGAGSIIHDLNSFY